MKKICVFALLPCLFLATGICAGEIPDLLGNWTGSWISYEEGPGFTNETEPSSLHLAFTEQEGRLFAGYLTIRRGNDTQIEEGFAGAIGLDNKTLHIAEFDRGYATGTMLSQNEMELIYLADGDNGSVAIDTLRRIEQ